MFITGSMMPPGAERAVRLRGSCIQCRKRKRKCDKQRPACSLCQHSKTECQYDTFQAYDSSAPHRRRKRKQADDTASEQLKKKKENDNQLQLPTLSHHQPQQQQQQPEFKSFTFQITTPGPQVTPSSTSSLPNQQPILASSSYQPPSINFNNNIRPPSQPVPDIHANPPPPPPLQGIPTYNYYNSQPPIQTALPSFPSQCPHTTSTIPMASSSSASFSATPESTNPTIIKSPTLSISGLLSDTLNQQVAPPMMSLSSLIRLSTCDIAQETILDPTTSTSPNQALIQAASSSTPPPRSFSISSVSSFSSDGSDQTSDDSASSSTQLLFNNNHVNIFPVTRDLPPNFSVDSYMDVRIPRSLRYLWSFYLQKTSRFCAIHDFETPFLSSIVPMAAKNEALQQSLMQLSGIYRNKILGYNDTNYDRTMIKLNVKSVRGLRNHIVTANLSTADALVGIATCLSLTCCAIGENNSESYNVHLFGALMLATQVLIPNPRFQMSADAWFLFKWTSYSLVLVNLNLLPCPDQLARAKAHNLPAMIKLYNWWTENALADPEYELPVDSFYGYGTQLTPLLLQFNILAYRKALATAGIDPGASEKIVSLDSPSASSIEPPSLQEIDTLEAQLWYVHQHSVLARYSEYTRKADLDLLHCNNAFHSAALLWLYTYLKPHDHFAREQRIPHLVASVLQEVMAINPACRTAAALLFVIYIVGSYAQGDQRSFVQTHLESMRTTCLSSVSAVLDALQLIWKLRDATPQMDMTECHAKVHDAGINVCLY